MHPSKYLLLVSDSDIGLHVLNKGGNVYGAAAFKCEVSVVACVLDSLENVEVVDFAGTGLVSEGVVSDMEVTDKVDILGDIADEIALGDLLMVNIEKHADCGTVHLADYIESFIGSVEEVAVVVYDAI